MSKEYVKGMGRVEIPLALKEPEYDFKLGKKRRKIPNPLVELMYPPPKQGLLNKYSLKQLKDAITEMNDMGLTNVVGFSQIGRPELVKLILDNAKYFGIPAVKIIGKERTYYNYEDQKDDKRFSKWSDYFDVEEDIKKYDDIKKKKEERKKLKEKGIPDIGVYDKLFALSKEDQKRKEIDDKLKKELENLKKEVEEVKQKKGSGKPIDFDLSEKDSDKIYFGKIEKTEEYEKLKKELYELLEQTSIPKITQDRGNLLGRNAWTTTFGCGNRRQLGFSEFNANKKFPELFDLLIKYGNLIVPRGYKYNAITLNKDMKANKHIDKQNEGYSIITGLGDFTGGDLNVFKNDKPIKYNLKGSILIFNGSKLYHQTDPFKGRRYTLIYYKQNKPCNVKGKNMIGI